MHYMIDSADEKTKDFSEAGPTLQTIHRYVMYTDKHPLIFYNPNTFVCQMLARDSI